MNDIYKEAYKMNDLDHKEKDRGKVHFALHEGSSHWSILIQNKAHSLPN